MLWNKCLQELLIVSWFGKLRRMILKNLLSIEPEVQVCDATEASCFYKSMDKNS